MQEFEDTKLRELMLETGWLRRLALSLVKDPALADDLAQDAWIVAAEKAPDDGRPLRPWLARVVLNLVRMRSRSDRRRSVRELVSSDEVSSSQTPAQLYERVETQRLLAETVLALDEPYRDVVLLHYVEGLSSVEIGRRLGIADGTVRWRLKTALAEMRTRLDRRSNGKRAAWLAPVAKLAGSRRTAGVVGAITLKQLIAGVQALGQENGQNAPTPFSNTDHEGRFQIGNLVPGHYAVHMRGADGAATTLDNVETGSDVTLTMVRAGSIEGTLTSFASSPTVVVSDHAAGMTFPALVSGSHFKSIGLTPGTYIVNARGGGADMKRVEVRPGQTAVVELASHGTARIELSLIRYRDRTPIAGADCVAAGSDFGYPAMSIDPDVHTDANGKAIIVDAPAGHVRVMCTPHDASMASTELDVPANGAATVTLVAVVHDDKGGDAGFEVQPFQLPTQVWHVQPRGPASAGGLVVGDVVIQIDGEDVTTISPLAAMTLVQNHTPGSVATLLVKRGETTRTIAIKVTRR